MFLKDYNRKIPCIEVLGSYVKIKMLWHLDFSLISTTKGAWVYARFVCDIV